MMRVILNARQRNPRLQFLGLLPSMVDQRNRARSAIWQGRALRSCLRPSTIDYAAASLKHSLLANPSGNPREDRACGRRRNAGPWDEYIRAKMGYDGSERTGRPRLDAGRPAATGRRTRPVQWIPSTDRNVRLVTTGVEQREHR